MKRLGCSETAFAFALFARFHSLLKAHGRDVFFLGAPSLKEEGDENSPMAGVDLRVNDLFFQFKMPNYYSQPKKPEVNRLLNSSKGNFKFMVKNLPKPPSNTGQLDCMISLSRKKLPNGSSPIVYYVAPCFFLPKKVDETYELKTR